MKWQKYSNLVAGNRPIGRVLDGLVGPPILRHGGSHPNFTMQEWVEQQLLFVAIRPWESLRMDDRSVSQDGLHAHYTIHFHIEGEEQLCARMRDLVGDDLDAPLSVLETFEHLVDWHGRYWALQENRPLVFDVVARMTSRWDAGERYAKESVDLWLPPEGFMP